MCSELPLCDRDVLERLLRTHDGDLTAALRSAIRTRLEVNFLPGNRGKQASGTNSPSRVAAPAGRRMLSQSDKTSTPRPSPEELTPRNGDSRLSSPAPPQAPQAPGGARTAIVISGCTGKYKLINDVYEPLQMSHQNKPCWRARSAAPVYLFHTGKSRWVISKRINVVTPDISGLAENYSIFDERHFTA
eukprot:g22458.t1